MQKSIPLFDLVELRVPGVSGGQTQTQFAFNDQPQLRGKKIAKIVFYGAGITFSPVSGTAVNTTADNRFLLLQDNNSKQVVKFLPLQEIRQGDTITNAGRVSVPDMGGKIIDWSKSTVQMTVAPANTTDMVLLFGVYYEA